MRYFEILLAGLGVGVVFGMFGAGGSAFATPILALIGLPGVIAVASPLPAMLPASFAGARRYLKTGNLDRRVAKLAIIGGVPGTIIGALASRLFSGRFLLVLSGVMLLVVGIRVLMPDSKGHGDKSAARLERTGLVVAATFAVGLLTGLLANGGGFLLVPLFVLGLGMTTTKAAGTSMVAVGVLTIPTLITHWALGHIDWPYALVFACGLLPASMLGARLSEHVPAHKARKAFGVLLVGFAIWYLIRKLA
ncbi:MAG: sulfite exporter TauE/SafE family protein [Ilumatobacteraceae bacterium]